MHPGLQSAPYQLTLDAARHCRSQPLFSYPLVVWKNQEQLYSPRPHGVPRQPAACEVSTGSPDRSVHPARPGVTDRLLEAQC